MEYERNLVTVTPIKSISPIEGADRIEVARVRGWDVVVGKDSYKVGDLVAYFEIDSALPEEDPRFAQFAERGTKTMPDGSKAHVLKTIKLRGQVSQGLIMSLKELGLPENAPEDTVLDEVLNIVKWEPPTSTNSQAAGSFLTQYADKTDSERVQNINDRLWEEISKHEWVGTEKVDGTSVTIIKEEDGNIRVCSRNLEVTEESLHFVQAVKSGIPELMEAGTVVQGEIVGPGIQGNPLQLNDTDILIFDMWRDRKIIPSDEWPQWAIDKRVPTYDLPFPATQDEAVAQVDKLKSLVNPKVQAEGIVWHIKSGEPIKRLGRTTFKAINNSFLLKGK